MQGRKLPDQVAYHNDYPQARASKPSAMGFSDFTGRFRSDNAARFGVSGIEIL